MGRPAASTVSNSGLLSLASRIVASLILSDTGAQSMSTARSVSYQTIEIRPSSPAASHGQNSMCPLVGGATVTGADHVRPSSVDDAYWIAFGVASAVLTEPPEMV